MVGVGEKIKNIRELRNLTQDYMATQLGITQAGYSKIESGTSQPNYQKLVKIAEILDISLEDMLGFDSQRYFNSFNNVKGNNNGSVNIHLSDVDVKRLYEDKISLLNRLLEKTEQELKYYKDRFGEM